MAATPGGPNPASRLSALPNTNLLTIVSALGFASRVPIRILQRMGTSPDTTFIPRSIFSILEGVSSRADPPPDLYTRSIGQPELRSITRKRGQYVASISVVLSEIHGLFA